MVQRCVQTSPFGCHILTTDEQGGIRKMLHLIWSKDNSSTSEDGKELKGIRSRLLECYRSLYFDPIPDMEAKQQVNRIAKNMIEYVHKFLLRNDHSTKPTTQAHLRRYFSGTYQSGRNDAHYDGRRPDSS